MRQRMDLGLLLPEAHLIRGLLSAMLCQSSKHGIDVMTRLSCLRQALQVSVRLGSLPHWTWMHGDGPGFYNPPPDKTEMDRLIRDWARRKEVTAV